MAHLFHQLRDWLARVEMVARGVEGQRAEAVQALSEGRPWEARTAALRMLDDLPRSRIALAIWADAAEAMLLDHEVAEAVERLAREVPFRADVWLRLARAREALGLDPGADLERAAEAGEPVEDADAARCWLADRDRERGDPLRADRWLARVSSSGRSSPGVLRRLVDVRLDLGLERDARRLAARLPEPSVLDGAAWLARGRLLALDGDPSAAASLERAMILEAPGAEDAASSYVAGLDDVVVLARFRETVDVLGRSDEAAWRAAFATAEGRAGDALAALADGARSTPSARLTRRYLRAAVAERDEAALHDALGLAHEQSLPGIEPMEALASALDESDPTARLNRLDHAHGEASGWAGELRSGVYRRWCPADAPASWLSLLAELAHLSRELGAVAELGPIESIARDLKRSVRVVIVGEFNAGKSSFVNGLLGEAVAPVGVLPTTNSVNQLVWAPDRFARVELRCGDDRVVQHADLRDTLTEIEPASVRRVLIYAPLEPLRRIELIDTPGFNAPVARHGEAARTAFEEAHVAIWLMDATQPFKESERAGLDEIRELRLPLLVLVNKTDRLSGTRAVAEVLRHVRAGLEAAGLKVEAEPVAFSARLALQPGASPRRSGWPSVLRVLDEVVVGKSDVLRDRALRRRARGIAVRLRSEAERKRVAQARREAREREGRERAARALERVAAEGDAFRALLRRELDDVLDALEDDLRPVAGMEGESAAARFVAVRTRSVVGPALAGAAGRFLEGDDLLAGRLRSRIEPMVAAASCAVRGVGGDPEASRERLALLLVDEVARVLEELGDPSAHLPEVPLLDARLADLCDALSVDAEQPQRNLNTVSG